MTTEPVAPSAVAAALAVVDQRAAELTDAEQLAAAALDDFASFTDQIAAFEARVWDGDPDADPRQLVELQGLARFAELRAEAAKAKARTARGRRDVAEVEVVMARHHEHAATHEAEFVEAFWSAVSALARLRRLDDERTETSKAFAAQRAAARQACIDAGDCVDTLARLDACPEFEVAVWRGTTVGLAWREAFPADDRFAQTAAALPYQARLAEVLPAVADARPADLGGTHA